MTTKPSIDDSTCTDIDIGPRTDITGRFATIETQDLPIDTADAKVIHIAGVDDTVALVYPLPEEVEF